MTKKKKRKKQNLGFIKEGLEICQQKEAIEGSDEDLGFGADPDTMASWSCLSVTSYNLSLCGWKQ